MEVVAGEQCAAVVRWLVLAGERREHDGVARHRAADAQRDVVGAGLAPELQHEAAVAGSDRAGVVEDRAVQRIEEGADGGWYCFATQEATAGRHGEEARLRRSRRAPCTRGGPGLPQVEDADGELGKEAAHGRRQRAGDGGGARGDDAPPPRARHGTAHDVGRVWQPGKDAGERVVRKGRAVVVAAAGRFPRVRRGNRTAPAALRPRHRGECALSSSQTRKAFRCAPPLLLWTRNNRHSGRLRSDA
jgi:hypothetical protein